MGARYARQCMGFEHMPDATFRRGLAGALLSRSALTPVASAARILVPCEQIGVSIQLDSDEVHVLRAGTGAAAGWREQVWPRSEYPDGLWSSPGRILHFNDLESAFDGNLAFVRSLRESGMRSLLITGPNDEQCPPSSLWLASKEVSAYSESHPTAAMLLGGLLGLAIRSEWSSQLEQKRSAKWRELEKLLPAIADTLDVHTLFPELSRLIQEVIPHVTVSLALLTADRSGVQIRVASNYDVGELPIYRFTSEAERIGANWNGFLAYDCVVMEEGVVRARSTPAAREPEYFELRPGPVWTRMLTKFGVRALLRVPVRVKGEAVGAISFGAAEPFAFTEDDVALAARIADHVALALAHEQLAEEARRLAQAEERASALDRQVSVLVQELEQRSFHRALGESMPWKRVLENATRVANAETTVLITGESGTGKEVVARYIHRGSRRANGPFVALNCAALPEALVESELFGYERGAFTGALASKPGKIEQAAGGVLFLDEVGEMPLVMQAKFLRVLQEREFQRLGGTRTIKADVRVVAATNRNPRIAVERGTLREDLYYRLNVFEILLPPLRQRPGDILLLAEAFLQELATTVGRPAAGISADARDQLTGYHWPGNVRELRNAMERAMILCDGGLVTAEHLPIRTVTPPADAPPVEQANSQDRFPSGGVNLAAMERDWIARALAEAKNNKSAAAKLLGIPRGQLYSLLRRHDMTDARR